MSQHAQNCVWQESKHKASFLVFLLAVADYADDHGLAYPGIERLARKSRMTARNVFNTIERAKASGELAVFPGASPYGTNIYQILLPGLHTEKFSVEQAQAILAAEAEGKAPPISGAEKFSDEKSSREFSGNPSLLKRSSLINKPPDVFNDESGEKFARDISGVKAEADETVDGIIEAAQAGPQWSKAPAHLVAILDEFTWVWCELYDRMLMDGDRRKFIKQAEKLHRNYGEGASSFIREAGEMHKKRDLTLNGPSSLDWAIRQAILKAAESEKHAEQFADFWDR